MQPSPKEKICLVSASIAFTISYPYISRRANSRSTSSSGTPFKKLGLVFFTTERLIPFTVRCCQHQTVRHGGIYDLRFTIYGLSRPISNGVDRPSASQLVNRKAQSVNAFAAGRLKRV